MNETLSTRQLRLVALLGLVVVCAGGYWLLVGRSTSSPSSASSTPVATTPGSTSTTPAPTQPHTRPSAPTKLATHGLPLVVARALHKHAIVVVSLASPRSGLDELASGEAQAGAHAGKVGFVKLDVLRQRQGVPILRKLGVIDTPAVLVVKRPNLVYAEFNGVVDRTVVEQAVADARG